MGEQALQSEGEQPRRLPDRNPPLPARQKQSSSRARTRALGRPHQGWRRAYPASGCSFHFRQLAPSPRCLFPWCLSPSDDPVVGLRAALGAVRWLRS